MQKKILSLFIILTINIVQSQNDGDLDISFDSTNGINETIYDIEVLPDNSIIVVGQFSSYDTNSTNSIAKINADGTLDLNFASNIGTGANSIIYSITSQSDGKLIVGGGFTIFNGQNYSRLVRLNQDGTIDSSFNIGSGTNESVLDIIALADDSILIGGYFNEYNGNINGGLAKLAVDGSLDSSFSFNQTGSTADIAITSNNQIVLNRFDKILKLDSNGNVDNTFSSATGLNIQSMCVLNNDNIIIGGYFTDYNGTPINRIARLNNDGTLDTSFNVGTGFDYGVLDIQEQPDSKLIVSGNFTNYNGVNRNYLIRLNSNGSLDPDFSQTNNGFDDDVLGTKLINNSGMYAYGKFLDYGGTSTSRIARLYNDYQLLSLEDFEKTNNISVYPNPVIENLNIKSNEKIKELAIYNLNGILLKKVTNSNTISFQNLNTGIYLLSVHTNSRKKQIKIIKN